MTQLKRDAASQANPIDQFTGKPEIRSVSPAAPTAKVQSDPNAVAPSPASVLGTSNKHADKDKKGGEA